MALGSRQLPYSKQEVEAEEEARVYDSRRRRQTLSAEGLRSSEGEAAEQLLTTLDLREVLAQEVGVPSAVGAVRAVDQTS